jgi:hypothetical protein
MVGVSNKADAPPRWCADKAHHLTGQTDAGVSQLGFRKNHRKPGRPAALAGSLRNADDGNGAEDFQPGVFPLPPLVILLTTSASRYYYERASL